MTHLPVDALLPELLLELTRRRVLVLEAEPGAGKTTRVPPALLDAVPGKILVSEPRRIAARLAARHVAQALGERVGQRVGYQVRFEDVSGPDTRLLYLTPGVLLQRLRETPELPGVSVVMLDEFHERQLVTDLCLALVRRLQQDARPELALIVASATLNAEELTAHLDGALRLQSRGRQHPLTIEHLARPDDRPLERQVAGAVRAALQRSSEGHLLVFLPGAAEIRRAAALVGPIGEAHGAVTLPLHGDMPLTEQARAIEPGSVRRIVLATNVAESSVTIPGVTTVIDSGLERVATVSPWSGVTSLSTGKISRASAAQRAGRAGRTAPGHVHRLYAEAELALRPARSSPEIERADLAEAALLLRTLGVRSFDALPWLTPPPASAVRAAEQTLTLLGASTPDGQLSAVGRRMADWPVAPRLARLIVAGEDLGIPEQGTLIAALLSERDLRLEARSFGARPPEHLRGSSDLEELGARLDEARRAQFDPRRLHHLGIDAQSARAVDRAQRQLVRRARARAPRPTNAAQRERAEALALLLAFPDRVARRRQPGGSELVLASGATARLAEASVVRDAELLLAVAVEDSGLGARRGGLVVRTACALQADWLLELELCQFSEELYYSPERERVESLSTMSVGAVVIEESRAPARASEAASELLVRAALAAGGATGEAQDALRRLAGRISFLAAHVPELGLAPPAEPLVEPALREAARGLTQLAELAELDLGHALLATLSAVQRAALDADAPRQIALPGGRTLHIHYEPGQPPYVASRLQDFFGMREVPRLARGRCPLVVQLLAPNQRAVQITTDLAGFWQRHYPALRRELMRRYPRHAWPEDGATASPPPPAPRRRT